MTPPAPTPAPPVTVLGLGAMGRALAGAFVAAGHPTTVWNRSPGRAADLVAAGAVEAADVGAAVDAARLTVVCLLDPAAVESVVEAAGTRWAGADVVNFTSSTPEDARSLADRFARHGATYLDGTVMVTTGLVGTADGHYLLSGDGELYERHRSTLGALGGTAELLGPDPGLAATYDLAMLDVFLTGMATFLHAAALVGADGVAARTFVPYARRMVHLLDDTLNGLADDVDRGEHDGTEDNLVMELAFLDHIVAAGRDRGLDTDLPQVVRRLAHDAVAAGHGADSFSRLIDVIRPRQARRVA